MDPECCHSNRLDSDLSVFWNYIDCFVEKRFDNKKNCDFGSDQWRFKHPLVSCLFHTEPTFIWKHNYHHKHLFWLCSALGIEQNKNMVCQHFVDISNLAFAGNSSEQRALDFELSIQTK